MNSVETIRIHIPSDDLSESDKSYTLFSSPRNSLSFRKNSRKSRRSHYNVTNNEMRAELIRRVTEENLSIRAVLY